MNPIRLTTHCFAALMAGIVITGTLLQAADNPNSPKEEDLIAVLKSGSAADKAITCKKLAIYGTKDCVPELAKLLGDKELASWARIPLEAITDPAADEALRAAVPTLKGLLLVGTLNSIGVRRDAGAAALLTERLTDSDAEVASAAAVALGRIGNEAATKTLRESLASAPAPVRSAVAEGCILCAERLMTDGKNSEAVAIYDQVRQAEVSKPRIQEATRGAILARGSEGIPLLIEQLRATDRGLFFIGLNTARELQGSEVSDALAAELTRTKPERAALILYALADRKDPTIPPAVLQASKSGDKQVRLAAVGFLGRSSDTSSLDTLLEIAGETDAELAQAAKTSLSDLPGGKIDSELATRLASAKGKSLPILIELAGSRRISAATPALVKAVENSDATIRQAALTSLGATAGPKEISVLITQAISTKNPADVTIAQKALREACVRMPDREACAAEVAAAIQKAPAAAKNNLLETLGAMGGAKALETIALVMKSGGELQDTGSRLLGEWMTIDAGPVLLDQAKTSTSDKYKVRALRAYIRIARQFIMPDGQRAEMCQNALDASTRADEQKLVLTILERYPSVDTLKVAAKATSVAALKDDAQHAAKVIAHKLGSKAADAQDLLKKIGIEPAKVEIVKAEYGAGTQQRDVTKVLQQLVGSYSLITLPKATYNESFGGDPAPNNKKELKVQYKLNGKAGTVTFDENATIDLPTPK